MRSFGPLSTPRGRVDVEVHPAMLRLRPRHAWIDLGDYGEVLLVVGALAVGAAGLFLTAPLRYVCFGVAAVVVLGVLLLHLVAYAVAAGALVMTAFRMLTKDGRQRLRQSVSTVRRQLDVGPRELSRGDIVSGVAGPTQAAPQGPARAARGRARPHRLGLAPRSARGPGTGAARQRRTFKVSAGSAPVAILCEPAAHRDT